MEADNRTVYKRTFPERLFVLVENKRALAHSNPDKKVRLYEFAFPEHTSTMEAISSSMAGNSSFTVT